MVKHMNAQTPIVQKLFEVRKHVLLSNAVEEQCFQPQQ